MSGVTIVNYGAGNIRSVCNMLNSLTIPWAVSSNPRDITNAERLILPGVGRFDFAMSQLHRLGLVEPLRIAAHSGTPLLGICLGAQLLTLGSEEGNSEGLGLIDAVTIKFDRRLLPDNLRIPHMGWANVWPVQENPLLPLGSELVRFYHVHSYHINCKKSENAILVAHYGQSFVTGIGHNNVFGVQFHPEKSHRFGRDLLNRYLRLSLRNQSTEH